MRDVRRHTASVHEHAGGVRAGENLIKNEGAPPGVHGLQFYPARDRTGATCLWEDPSVEAIQRHVDTTLGDFSVNTCYEVDAAQAFMQQPSGIREFAAITP
ncbi:DUF4242 domain-containing protein [Arthrobacter sp. CJ23]|uniref:DUF4242 domain-containing protein n=1 Tax=Arthrobacter sp. CJ23 TaxID=2972479 RepID=UPI00215BBAB1|nr:DUF4242 domain-containing protein [Arthrobacter sp. CJ23]UVJ41284.1 DUF4242 domain-containing protein [Arthrobacter sp. CJ23]